MPRALVVCLTLAIVVGCREQSSVTSPQKPSIAAALLDGGQGGNPHFFFLPPLVEQPSFSGTLNSHLAPVVQICTLTSGAVCDPSIAPIDPGIVSLRGDHYEVIWNARATSVDPTRSYRVQVFAGGELLGFVDAQIDGTGAVITRTGGSLVGPSNRGTLPIKFRIENGALCAGQADCGEAVIGAGGGTVIVASGGAGALFPPGALTRTVTVFVAQTPTSPEAPCLPVDLVQRGGCFTFRTDPGPNTFTTPVTVGICVEIEGWTPEQLSLLHLMQVDVVANEPVVTTLPNVAAPFLTCDAPHPLALRMRLLDGLRRLLVPTPLYAAHLGVGGLTGSFSTIGWGLPTVMAGQAGDGQTAVVGTAVALPPAVILRDSLGAPVQGQTVRFSVTTGRGNVTGAKTITDAAGVATVGSWTLGLTPGTNTLLATSRRAVGSPITVTATGIAFSALEAGERHSCAIATNGVTYCWGSNVAGQLGDGGAADRHVPAAVSGAPSFVGISSSFEHTCALGTQGQVSCWGRNTEGQLGDGTTTNRATPVAVASAVTFSAVTSGGVHTCALTASGAAYCWGDNTRGQLGTGNMVSSSTPVPVQGGIAFASISAGFFHTCGLTGAGAAFCWGFSGLGNTTTEFSTVPVAVSGGLTFVAVASGSLYTCALTAAGAAYCWGSNASGQLGSGPASLVDVPLPTLVAGGLSFVFLSADNQNDIFDHTCGITATNAAYCWGENVAGELGAPTSEICPGFFANNPPHACASAPVAVSGGLSFTKIAVGIDHTCGITTSGQMYCWGGNSNGQLGNGTTTPSPSPVLVSGPASDTP